METWSKTTKTRGDSEKQITENRQKRRTIKMQIEKGEKGINIYREENTGNTQAK